MSYANDGTGYTRGVGAVAALDAGARTRRAGGAFVPTGKGSVELLRAKAVHAKVYGKTTPFPKTKMETFRRKMGAATTFRYPARRPTPASISANAVMKWVAPKATGDTTRVVSQYGSRTSSLTTSGMSKAMATSSKTVVPSVSTPSPLITGKAAISVIGTEPKKPAVEPDGVFLPEDSFKTPIEVPTKSGISNRTLLIGGLVVVGALILMSGGGKS